MITRLRTFIKSLGISERAFALNCGIAQNTMTYYLSEQRKPSYEAVEKILSSYPDLSAEWLTRGNGNMLLSQCGVIQESERIEKLIGTIESLQEVIDCRNAAIKEQAARIEQLESELKK